MGGTYEIDGGGAMKLMGGRAMKLIGGQEKGPAYAFTPPRPELGTETRGTLCDSPSQVTTFDTHQQCPLG